MPREYNQNLFIIIKILFLSLNKRPDKISILKHYFYNYYILHAEKQSVNPITRLNILDNCFDLIVREAEFKNDCSPEKRVNFKNIC